jgi:hypothetical protein
MTVKSFQGSIVNIWLSFDLDAHVPKSLVLGVMLNLIILERLVKSLKLLKSLNIAASVEKLSVALRITVEMMSVNKGIGILVRKFYLVDIGARELMKNLVVLNVWMRNVGKEARNIALFVIRKVWQVHLVFF